MSSDLATVEWFHPTVWWIKHPSRPCTDKRVRRQARAPPRPGGPHQRP